MLVSMFLWGLSWPSGKVLSRYCSPVNFSAYRYIIVIITLGIVLLFAKVSFRMLKGGIVSVVASGALLAIYSYLMVKGLQAGTGGAGGVMVTTLNPILAYAIGIVLSRKLPSVNESIGLLLGLVAGCTLLQLWTHAHAIVESGNLYFLLAAFTWAVMSKITARGARYGSPLGFIWWQYVITFVCLAISVDYTEARAMFSITDNLFWLNLFFGSAIVTSIATTVYFYTTTRLGAEKASSFIFLVPAAAALSSWLLLDEQIKVHTIAGGLLGIVAVYMINRKPMNAVPATGE